MQRIVLNNQTPDQTFDLTNEEIKDSLFHLYTDQPQMIEQILKQYSIRSFRLRKESDPCATYYFNGEGQMRNVRQFIRQTFVNNKPYPRQDINIRLIISPLYPDEEIRLI